MAYRAVTNPTDILRNAARPKSYSTFIPRKRDWRYATGVFQHEDFDEVDTGKRDEMSFWDELDESYNVPRKKRKTVHKDVDTEKGVGGQDLEISDEKVIGKGIGKVIGKKKKIGKEKGKAKGKGKAVSRPVAISKFAAVPRGVRHEEGASHGAHGEGEGASQGACGGEESAMEQPGAPGNDKEGTTRQQDDAAEWLQTGLITILKIPDSKEEEAQAIISGPPAPNTRIPDYSLLRARSVAWTVISAGPSVAVSTPARNMRTNDNGFMQMDMAPLTPMTDASSPEVSLSARMSIRDGEETELHTSRSTASSSPEVPLIVSAAHNGSVRMSDAAMLLSPISMVDSPPPTELHSGVSSAEANRKAKQRLRERKRNFLEIHLPPDHEPSSSGNVASAESERIELMVTPHIDLPLRHVFTFPFLGMQNMVAEAYRLGIAKAELKKEEREKKEEKEKEEKMRNSICESQVAGPVGEDVNETNDCLTQPSEGRVENSEVTPPKEKSRGGASVAAVHPGGAKYSRRVWKREGWQGIWAKR